MLPHLLVAAEVGLDPIEVDSSPRRSKLGRLVGGLALLLETEDLHYVAALVMLPYALAAEAGFVNLLAVGNHEHGWEGLTGGYRGSRSKESTLCLHGVHQIWSGSDVI